MHVASRDEGERSKSLSYLLEDMGKPYDLITIPKECPEGKSTHVLKTHTQDESFDWIFFWFQPRVLAKEVIVGRGNFA